MYYSLWLFLFEIFLRVSISSSGKVPAIIVFGDSSVDSGNNNFIPTMARSNFEPYGRDFPNGNPTGRFSNGRIAPDFISEGFGLKPTVPAYLDPAYNISDFATGVCFASAGTGFDNATSNVAVSVQLLVIILAIQFFCSALCTYFVLIIPAQTLTLTHLVLFSFKKNKKVLLINVTITFVKNLEN